MEKVKIFKRRPRGLKRVFKKQAPKPYWGVRVTYTLQDITGTIKGIYLYKDESRHPSGSVVRSKDLYKVRWDNGKKGVIELEDKTMLILE